MPEQYYIVELRCGTCGIIFAASKDPLPTDKADELSELFKKKGPSAYRQCKNRCTRKHPYFVMPEDKNSGPMNYNQKVVKTIVPYNELKMRGLAS